ncbi:MAG: class I SAM-dependent methyltransferase [Chloroflexi bacterium]|nr:MAG: class I SAM-dependent methyltransferase [Chloroflexota bacterium]
MTEAEVKQQVRQFYDHVGWQVVQDGTYQNARYEDLRPVSREYIHRCHLRVNRFLRRSGRYLLDAGSGPVQYAEYLTFSDGYQRRVCVDISIIALQEARRRIGDHGLFVVADVANLPFKSEPFEGAVSLHTLHHLPLDEQAKAYAELYRVLRPGSTAVVVNGWTDSPLMRRAGWLVRAMERLGAVVARLRGRREFPGKSTRSAPEDIPTRRQTGSLVGTRAEPTGTFINKLDPGWLRRNIGSQMHYELYPWRSVSVRFLRAAIHEITGGRLWLRLLFWLEERFPRFFAEKGQYPMVILHKDA